jgi:flagellar hook-associated protein 2
VTSFSISGLSSGIDTTSVITQLMSIAAAPQTALKTRLSTTKSELSAYQTINTKMAAVQTAADALALASTWKATTATSSDSSIVATGSATATAGSATTFSVTAMARAQTTTAPVSDTNNAAVAANGIDITIGSGSATHISLSGSKLSDVVSAINSAGLGVKASVITTSSGASVLQLNGTSSGAANSFSISGLTDTTTNIATAQDAQVTVGDPSAGGYTLSSSTNTFTNAIPGVTFTVSKLTTDATISVGSDADSIAKAVQTLVTAANDALTTIGQATAQGAILAGDNTVSSLTQKILSVVSAGAGGKSLSDAGIEITSAGQLTFDSDTFSTAYAADPSSIQSMVQTSFASGMSTVGKNATDSASGTLTQLINSDNSQITSLNKQISDWDTRLSDQKTALETKYAAMEAALSKLKSESSYLTSMFNSLNGTSSSSSSSSSSSN